MANKLLFLLNLASFLLSVPARRSCPAVTNCLAALNKGEPCPILPTPKNSLPDPIAAKGFNVTQIRSGVFRYEDGFYSTIILYAKKRLVLVDFPLTGSSFGPNGTYHLTTAVTEVVKQDVPKRLDMVYTHRHTDHIGGAALLKDFAEESFPGIDVFVWGTAETKMFISRAKNPEIPLPNILVRGPTRNLRLSKSLHVKLRVVGGHVDSDIAAHVLPSRDGPGTLHYVDVLTPGAVPFLQFAVTIDLGKYLKAQRDLLKLDFDTLNAGHGLLGSKKDVRINIRYTNFVIKAAADAITNANQSEVNEFFRRRLNPDDVAFGNTQFVFGGIYDLWRDACVRKTIERWGCLLTGVDLFSPSHCVSGILYNSIDNHVGFSL